VPLAKKHEIAAVIGFPHGALPLTYMGVPLFQGNTKARIKVKLAHWKGLMLSIMGRVQQVNSMINNMLAVLQYGSVVMGQNHLL
jgi:hypothetical protein